MPTCDLLFTHATLIDGTGAARRAGALAVSAGRIAAVGDCAGWQAARTIDAGGRVLAPGFIDVHTHDDSALLADPAMAAKTSQGVTSVIAGNCGISIAPLVPRHGLPPPLMLLGEAADYRFPTVADYRRALEAAPPSVNVGLLVGHSTLRAGAMDDTARAATGAEIEAMAAALDQALRDGGLGLSTGLSYPASRAAPTAEVVALARVTARHPGALYTTHMRSERDQVVEAVGETLEIGRKAAIPVVISHHKCIGRRNFGKTTVTLGLIDKALATQDVALDVYPYTASSTVLLPEFVGEAERIIVTSSQPHPEQARRDLSAIAADWGVSLEDAAARLGPATAIYFQMDEADLRRVLSHPRTMIGSDGIPGPYPHPRLWGSFPRVLGHYARELGLLTLEDAVRRMTSLPAAVFGLPGRGVLQAGYAADLVLFDPGRVIDRADYDQPCEPSAGIDAVYVNGLQVWGPEGASGAAAGQFLHH